MEFEDRIYFNFRIGMKDIILLQKWTIGKDLSVSYCIRQGVKLFIEKYVEGNGIPPTEIVNKGCIGKNKLPRDENGKKIRREDF